MQLQAAEGTPKICTHMLIILLHLHIYISSALACSFFFQSQALCRPCNPQCFRTSCLCTSSSCTSSCTTSCTASALYLHELFVHALHHPALHLARHLHDICTTSALYLHELFVHAHHLLARHLARHLHDICTLSARAVCACTSSSCTTSCTTSCTASALYLHELFVHALHHPALHLARHLARHLHYICTSCLCMHFIILQFIMFTCNHCNCRRQRISSKICPTHMPVFLPDPGPVPTAQPTLLSHELFVHALHHLALHLARHLHELFVHALHHVYMQPLQLQTAEGKFQDLPDSHACFSSRPRPCADHATHSDFARAVCACTASCFHATTAFADSRG